MLGALWYKLNIYRLKHNVKTRIFVNCHYNQHFSQAIVNKNKSIFKQKQKENQGLY